MKRQFKIFFAVLTFSLMSGSVGAALHNTSAWETELLQARAAHLKSDTGTLDKAHDRGFGALAGHPLEVYAQYWRLSAHIAANHKSDHGAIVRFLERYHDTRLAEQLRREWLKQLGKLQDWASFNTQYVKFAAEDQEVTCYAWQARLEKQDREALDEAKALWNAGKSAPEPCDALFNTLLAQKRLSANEIWVRIRKLLEAGDVAEVKRHSNTMPQMVTLPQRMLALIVADPGRYLVSERLNVKSRPSIELGLFAMQRLARRDAPEAADWLVRRGAALSDEDKRFAWAQIGLHAAQQHEPRALEWYALAGGHRLSDAQAAWKVRAALRAQDWPVVQAGIAAMPLMEQRAPAWRYWLARALNAQGNIAGNKTAADTLLQGLSSEMNFYGLLAAEDLGVLAAPQWNAFQPQRTDIDAVLARPALQRAFLLYQVDLPGEGLREWFWAVRDMDDKQLLATAEAASELAIPDRAMRAAERTVQLHDFSRRYPIPFRELLSSAAKKYQLDEAWVYGLIKQESAFVSEARSRVGATGLMQLMPATAKSMAKLASLKDFQVAKLAQVETNVLLGAHYLRHVLDDLGDQVLATAAYNAGPGRARRWRSEAPLEGAIYAETIPFDETRDYVKRVMANAFYYASRLGTPKSSFKNMIGVVPSRSSRSVNTAAAPSLSQPTIPTQ